MNKNYAVYHWDTFDNITTFVTESDSIPELEKFVEERYKDILWPDGADIVEIVSNDGIIQRRYRIR